MLPFVPIILNQLATVFLGLLSMRLVTHFVTPDVNGVYNAVFLALAQVGLMITHSGLVNHASRYWQREQDRTGAYARFLTRAGFRVLVYLTPILFVISFGMGWLKDESVWYLVFPFLLVGNLALSFNLIATQALNAEHSFWNVFGITFIANAARAVLPVAVGILSTTGYNIRLMPADTTGQLPDQGSSLIIVAKDGAANTLYLRIFDRAGTNILDWSESEFPNRSNEIAVLKSMLADSWNSQELAIERKNQIIRAVKSVTGYAPFINLIGLSMGFALHGLVILACLAFVFRKSVISPPAPEEIHLKWVSELKTYGRPFILLGIGAWLFQFADRWITLLFFGSRDAGLLAIAANLTGYVPAIAVQGMMQWIFPRIFRMSDKANTRAEWRHIAFRCDQATGVFLVLTIGGIVTLKLIAPFLVGWLIGDKYIPAFGMIIPVGFAMVAAQVNQFYYLILQGQHNSAGMVKAMLTISGVKTVGSIVAASISWAAFEWWMIASLFVSGILGRMMIRAMALSRTNEKRL